MITLEDYIGQNASRYPDKVAIVCDQERCSYKELQEKIISRTIELKNQSYQKGQIVCLRAWPSLDYLVTYFALHQIGCVVTPLEKNIPEASFHRISDELCAHAVPDGSADILYTTGTTGKSKGAIISHHAIIADAENLIDGQGFSHDLVFVVNGPLNHIGSLSKVYPVMMLGATLIITDGLKDINAFYQAFNYPASKMATFLVPASIRILLQFSVNRLASLADKIDFIETGAAAISQADMESLCKVLPKSRLYNTYASTETGIISTYNFNDGKCEAGCLGKPMKHSEIVITDKGLISCKGDTIMSGYVGDPERTATVLRDGVIYTSDVGMLDDEGMLHLAGREDDVINVGGFKVAPTEVENVAMEIPEIIDCICVAAQHPVLGTALKLLVVLEDGAQLDKKKIARYIKSELESYKVPFAYEAVDSICRTYNGKIDRKHYR